MLGWLRIRPIVSGAVVLCWVVFAGAGSAANLKDVRVGPHGEYTRVVLETDAKTSYSLNQTDDVVTIELQASATPKAVTAKSQQLSWVRVEPAGASTLVKIELKGPARLKQMVLTGPSRIVLDVFGGAAASVSPEPVREPAVAAQPVPVAPAVSATEPRAEVEDALVGQEATDLLGPEAAPLPSDEVAATEGVPAESTVDGAAAGNEETGALPGAEPQTPPPASIAQSSKPKRGLLYWLADRWILSTLAVVMLALVVILRRKRPFAREPKEAAAREVSAASLFGASPDATVGLESGSAGEGSAAGGFSELSDSVAASEASSARARLEEGGSGFEFEAPDVEPEKPEAGPAQGATLSTIGAVTSTATYETKAPTATGGLSMAELDRRLALLEQRLEEVIDAKDRLERQVSAQTEELRVQRAAIARTQRVLRTVVRPEDDQPSEPVLKS